MTQRSAAADRGARRTDHTPSAAMPTACPRVDSRHAWASCAERARAARAAPVPGTRRALAARGQPRTAGRLDRGDRHRRRPRARDAGGHAHGGQLRRCLYRDPRARRATARPGTVRPRRRSRPRPAGRAECHMKRAHAGARRPLCAAGCRPGDGRHGRRRLHRGAALRLQRRRQARTRPVLAGVRRPLGRSATWESGYKPAAGSVRYILKDADDGTKVVKWRRRARHGRRAQGHSVPDDRHRVRRQDRALRCVRDALDRRRRGRRLRAATRSSSTTASGLPRSRKLYAGDLWVGPAQ